MEPLAEARLWKQLNVENPAEKVLRNAKAQAGLQHLYTHIQEWRQVHRNWEGTTPSSGALGLSAAPRPRFIKAHSFWLLCPDFNLH
jgi:hypothetical protein